jgi:hypothetical protein
VSSSQAKVMDSQPARLLSFLFFARLWQLAKRKLQLPPVTVKPRQQFLLSGHV